MTSKRREAVAWFLIGLGAWILWTELGVVRFWLLMAITVGVLMLLAPLDIEQIEERVVPPLPGCTCGYPARRPCDHRGGCVHSGYGDEWQEG